MRDLVQANGGDKSYFWNGYAQACAVSSSARMDGKDGKDG